MRRRSVPSRVICCLCLAYGVLGAASPGLAAPPTARVSDGVGRALAQSGTVRVIVQLDVPMVPEGVLRSRAGTTVATQRAQIADSQEALLADIAGRGARVKRRFKTIPFIALEVGQPALDALLRSPRVLGIEEDRLSAPVLDISTRLVQADDAWTAGYDGTGQTIVIIDSGVDRAHPFLAGKVVAEACYSDGGGCPNGQDYMSGAGAAAPCTYAPIGCAHGTHVAGIAAGAGGVAGGTTFDGVARGASLVAIQVFHLETASCRVSQGEEYPCARTWDTDWTAALEHALLLSGLGIAAANLSVGGGEHPSQCDSSLAAAKAAIDNLRSIGIATVAASGNDSYSTAMNHPACISTAISVGRVDDSDQVYDSSNSAPFLSLLAPGGGPRTPPGRQILSSLPGGGYGEIGGTSMSAPHVSGAWAILRQRHPSASVSQILTMLQVSGRGIVDARNGDSFPRIRIREAMDAPSDVVWVDFSASGLPIGTFFQPAWTLPLGITLAGSGGTVVVKAGATSATMTLDTPVMIRGWGGTAEIGQ